MDQGNQQQFGPQELLNLVVQLGQHVTTLTQQVTATNNSLATLQNTVNQFIGQLPVPGGYGQGIGAAKAFVARPAAFTGKGSSGEARHFRAAFANWATSTGSLLNDRDLITGSYNRNDEKWIRAALNYFTEEAKSWALPHLESLETGRVPWRTYNLFIEDFKKRFEPIDAKLLAQNSLKHLHQGKSTVAEYKAKFDEQSASTGFSDTDLRDRFYENLNENIKDYMVHNPGPKATLQECYDIANSCDLRMREREAEKKGKPLVSQTRSTTSSVPAHDPNAMEIDAARLQAFNNGKGLAGAGPNGKTIQDWKKAFVNRCNKCGSKDHMAAQGGHERVMCQWCKKVGHLSSACMRKFMGHPPTPATQSVKATETGSSSGSAPASGSSQTVASGKTSSGLVASDTAKAIAELQAQIEKLQKGQEALNAAF